MATSTALLKIVAEAASAYRTGSDVYVAARDTFPYDREVFFSYDGSSNPQQDAEDFVEAQKDDENWALFGPYVTDADEPATAWTALNYRVTIDVTAPDGETSQHVLSEEIDALFLTLPAIDKFVVPYYTNTIGAERALDIRRQFIDAPEPMGHVWNSKFIPASEIG